MKNEKTSILPDNQKIYNLISDKLDKSNLDFSKLNRQILIIRKWIADTNARGYVTACTGFGKTMIALISIMLMNLKNPLNNIIVVVPNTNLYNDWCDPNYGYIATLGLQNVKVYVVNTYVKDLNLRYSCRLLILDEGHRYAREDADNFSKVINVTHFARTLVLSATLGIKEKQYLESFGIGFVDDVPIEEAQKNNWIANFLVFNIPAELSPVDVEREKKYTNSFNTHHSYFNYDFDLASGCNIANHKRKKHPRYGWLTGSQYRQIVAKEMNISEQQVRELAGKWYHYMRSRKDFLHQVENKTLIAEEILNKTNFKTIFFSEYTNIADSLKKRLGDEAVVYHSNLPTLVFESETSNELIAVGEKVEGKRAIYRTTYGNKLVSYKELKEFFPDLKRYSGNTLKSKIKEWFKNDVYRILLTSKALDEGYDDDSIEMGIVHSGSSKKLQSTQRFGRVLRVKLGKIAYIVNIYVKGTQDEKWLRNRLKGTPPSKVFWVNNVDAMIETINSNVKNNEITLT